MQNEIIILIGPKGSGKTYYACEQVKKMDRVVIFDMVGEPAYAQAIGYVLPEPTMPVSQNEDIAIIEGQPRELAKVITPDKEFFKVIYRPTKIEMDKNIVVVPEFGPVTKLVYLRGDCWYVIDEAHLLTDSYNCPKELMIANLLGRHRRMSMVFVSQSFTGIHPKIRRNADTFIFWRIIEPSDLEAIRKRCGNDVEEKVMNLRVLEQDKKTGALIRPGQHLVWDKLHGIVEESE
jgi:hypothetical protein